MKITIIPSDNTIMVDGVPRSPKNFVYPEDVKAIQWTGSEGYIEYNNGTQEHFSDYGLVEPYVLLHTEAGTPELTIQQEIDARIRVDGLVQEWQVYAAVTAALSFGALLGKTEAQLYDEDPNFKKARDLKDWVDAKKLE